jgi:enoyl-CoA hydratase/carnithine racemase
MPSTIEIAIHNGIMTITLNRPEKLNAFNQQMRDDLLQAFDDAEGDEIRVVVVTGAGKHFCAGGEVVERDFDDYPRRPDGQVDYSHPSLRDDGGVVALKIFDCTKPVIGAVNGAAVGFGATVVLPMDIRLGSEKARVGFPFASLGTIPEATSTWFLPKLVGTARAIEWCLVGDLRPAEELLAAGFFQYLYPADDLLAAANALAEKIANRAAPVSAALTRQMMWRLPSEPHPMAAHIVESRLLHDRKRTADMPEGIASFMGKRPPVFPDRVSTDMPPSYPWWRQPSYDDVGDQFPREDRPDRG